MSITTWVYINASNGTVHLTDPIATPDRTLCGLRVGVTSYELETTHGRDANCYACRRAVALVADRWVVKPWSADDIAPTETTADAWFVQDSRLGYCSQLFEYRAEAEELARAWNESGHGGSDS